MADEDDLIPKSWLVERVDPAKAEADGHVDGTPWERIRRYLQPNDEIWPTGPLLDNGRTWPGGRASCSSAMPAW